MNSIVFSVVTATMLASCSSGGKEKETEGETVKQSPITDTIRKDTTAQDAVNATGSMNGSNNSGVNSSDGKPQHTSKNN